MKKNIIISIIGLIVLIYGFIEYNNYSYEHNIYKEQESEVTRIEMNSGEKIIEFKIIANNKEYLSTIAINENLEVGSTRKIFYNQKNPSLIKIKLITITKSIIILVIGLIITTIGLALIIKNKLDKGDIKNLKEKGIHILADITDVIVIPKDNGKNPYILKASYLNPNNNILEYYESEETFINLKEIIDRKNITKIDIYINPKHTERYFVDIESIIN